MIKYIYSLFLVLLFTPLHGESVSLGPHGSLHIPVPDGWKMSSKAVGAIGCNIALSPNADVNAKCLISVIYPPAPTPVDKAKVERDLTAACAQYVTGSVEQKIELRDLKLSDGYGLYATFTDASLVGKESSPGNYKVMSSALAQFSSDVIVVASVLSDDANGVEHKTLLRTISALKVDPR